MTQKVKVYARDSLSSSKIKKIVEHSQISTQLESGNIFEDIESEYDVIVIIDGSLNVNEEVSVSEIRLALEAGIRIYGSSHVGAVVATAAQPYGAFPVGKIAHFISDSDHINLDWLKPPFPDDLLKDKHLSYMDIYFGMSDCVSQGLVTEKDNADVCRYARKLMLKNLSKSNLKDYFKSNAYIIKAIEKVYALKSQREKDAVAALSLVATHKKMLDKKWETYEGIQQAENITSKLFPSQADFEADKIEWFNPTAKVSSASLNKLMSRILKSKNKNKA